MEFNNEYLNKRLSEIVEKDNFFEVILELKEFEKEYKQSNFYKTTKINLMDLVKDARIFYLTNTKNITDKLNKIINSLDGEKIAAILDEGASILQANNEETLAQLQEFKELGGADIIKNQTILNKKDKNIN